MICKKLMLLIIAGVITTSPVYAIAHGAGDSDEMKGAITKALQGVHEDVEHGSINRKGSGLVLRIIGVILLPWPDRYE